MDLIWKGLAFYILFAIVAIIVEFIWSGLITTPDNQTLTLGLFVTTWFLLEDLKGAQK